MSKIAKKPIEIKEGVQASLEAGKLKISGPKGELIFVIPHGVGLTIEENKILISKLLNKYQNLDQFFTQSLS